MVTILFHSRESFKVEEQHDSFKKDKRKFFSNQDLIFVCCFTFLFMCVIWVCCCINMKCLLLYDYDNGVSFKQTSKPQ
jgi:hypothetical protein